jgi:hypothetical protein
MDQYRWNETKSRRLKLIRGVSFEEILSGRLIDIVEHSQKPHQKKMIIEYGAYCWVVPFVMDGNARFLKTLYPSRQASRYYLKKEG